MGPVIGITVYAAEADWRGWPVLSAVLPWTYVAAIRESGGRVVLLPPGGTDAEAEATVAELDGVVLAGGTDVDPARYGARPHPQTVVSDPDRDSWEFAVAGAALREGVPLLGICRGMQLLNVSLGGTLHQHVPDMVGHEVHSGPANGYGQHRVRVTAGQTVAGILPGGGYFMVPTHHHQAVDTVGAGLMAVAWADDGVIEAIEAVPDAAPGLGGFLVGVQWHPEEGRDMRLFGALVEAAARRRGARRLGDVLTAR